MKNKQLAIDHCCWVIVINAQQVNKLPALSALFRGQTHSLSAIDHIQEKRYILVK